MLLAGLLLASQLWATPLDDYVNKPDSHYSWTDTGKTFSGRSPDGKHKWTGYILNMTSQQWLTAAESSQPIWYHTMVVIVPDNVDFKEHGFLWITGGHTGSIPNVGDEDIKVVAEVAMGVGAVGAALFQIPNEPIVFPSDPIKKSRSEDAIIAYAWDHFVKHPDQPEWLLRLPMTKACVRAIDTVIDFRKRQTGDVITKFIAAGASKRGWTTWTLGAVEKRLIGIIPIVMDELNFVKNIHHHFRAYGGWSFALQDYYDMNFTDNIDHPNTQKMMDIIDPIAYKDRYTMPMLVCNAGGDEFFLPDDTRYWWDQLPGQKNFLMVPNAEHSMATGIFELLPAVAAWAIEVIHKKPIQPLSWKIDDKTGDITAVTSEKPKKVMLWHSQTCHSNRRDFRLANVDKPCLCGIAQQGLCINLEVLWNATELKPTKVEGGVYTYVAHRDVVPKKWTAFFIDFVFDRKESVTPAMRSLKRRVTATDDEVSAEEQPVGWPVDWGEGVEFTTEVSIIPNTFPHADCSGAACRGKLL